MPRRLSLLEFHELSGINNNLIIVWLGGWCGHVLCSCRRDRNRIVRGRIVVFALGIYRIILAKGIVQPDTAALIHGRRLFRQMLQQRVNNRVGFTRGVSIAFELYLGG